MTIPNILIKPKEMSDKIPFWTATVQSVTLLKDFTQFTSTQ